MVNVPVFFLSIKWKVLQIVSKGKTKHKLSSCEKHYKQLHSKSGLILTASFRSKIGRSHSVSHNFISDFETWIGVLSGRLEGSLLKSALREYQFALLALAQGQYRQSFMALRLFLELALSSIYFSANELELREWLKGQKDIAWNSLVDLDKGVFSKRFVRAFYEGLADEAPHYGTIAAAVYRECSEFVHGNALTHDALPATLTFAEDVFTDWHAKALSVRLVVVFALCARYLKDLKDNDHKLLEPHVIDSLGHIPAIRTIFGGVTEAKE